MYRKLKLDPLDSRDNPIEFEWDIEAGLLRGPDAQVIQNMAADAKSVCVIVGDPYPTSYEITDPLKKQGELAAILSVYYHLPDDLLASIKRPGDDGELPTLTDENGIEQQISVIN
jgi:hypothetical protein